MGIHEGGNLQNEVTREEHHHSVLAKRVAIVDGSGNQVTSFAEDHPSTSAVTSVNDTATSTTLLSANTSRKEAIFANDSSSTLYIKLGTTASATDYTVKLGTDDIFTTGFTGRIDGIWSADSSGSCKITELS